MTITIYQGYDNSYIMVGSKDERFAATWGNVVKVPNNQIYNELSNIAAWVNNDLGEECLFEID